MAIFRLAVQYAGTSAEEIVEFSADSVSSAKAKCEELMRENEEMLKRAESQNIYVSRRMSSCRLCPYEFRLEMMGCELISVLSSKDEV